MMSFAGRDGIGGGRRRRLLGAAAWLLLGVLAACGGGRDGAQRAALAPARVKMQGDNPSGRGFADYHAHMFSHLAFGGYLFAGAAYPRDPRAPDAAAQALAPCRHTSFLHPITHFAVEEVEPGHSAPDGYPDFATWPRFDTHLHQQMYIDWVYRAYQYGLRLVSITITNNETLCEFVHHPGPCNDMAVVDLQLAEIERMANAESGWMGIAHSAAEAEEIVRSNRLALVIAIEVDTLFDCGISRERKCACTAGQIEERLQRYYDRGVRQIIPIHMADNGFGGGALYKELLANNHYLRRKYYVDYYDCFDAGVDWTLRGGVAVPFLARASAALVTGRMYDPDIAETHAEGHCNALGLTSDCGATLLRAMMRRGMLIDVEHMSQRAVDSALALAEAASYPLMLSHTWLRDLKLPRERVRFARVHDAHPAHDPWDEQRAEMHRDARTIRRIAALGGVVGVLTNQGPIEIPVEHGAFPVANDCDGSSRSFAQAYSYAVELMGARGGVGFGTDFNGLAGQPSPRFGEDACAGGIGGAARRASQRRAQEAENARVPYDGSVSVGGRPLAQMQVGRRRFDVNEDGLAQYGLLPDFIADLALSGLPDEQVERLYGSAMAFVSMWRRAESHSASRMNAVTRDSKGKEK